MLYEPMHYGPHKPGAQANASTMQPQLRPAGAQLSAAFPCLPTQVLLNDATGRITSGLYAVMGPSGAGLEAYSCRQCHICSANPGHMPLTQRMSVRVTAGSGKTTLLNTLACRLDRNVEVKSQCITHTNIELQRLLDQPCKPCLTSPASRPCDSAP